MERIMEPIPEQIQESTIKNKFSGEQIAIFLVGIIFVLALLGAAFTAFRSSSNPQNSYTVSSEQPEAPHLASKSLVYGSWTNENSLINSYDLDSGQTTLLASLPINIKKITVLDNDRLLFIGDTDTQDHGANLSIYSVKNKTITPLITAADNFGIDDYVLSPNKQFLSLWEVQINPSTNALIGGESRVYSVDLQNPSLPHLLFDEISTATTPINYPRAILDNGTVYSDTFLPNSGEGWAYGITISNFDGTQKQDVASMTNGTYGTQPSLSPNGHYLVFAGYNGSQGSGTEDLNGFRRALVLPNTIELLDTSTNQRILLPDLDTKNVYSNITWDSNTTILFRELVPGFKNIYYYKYDINTHQITKLPQPAQITADTVSSPIFTQGTATFYADKTISDSTIGNLGPSYSQPYTKIYAIVNNNTVSIPISTLLAQYIGVVPNSITGSQMIIAPSIDQTPSNDSLHLGTLVLKEKVIETRITQQSSKLGSSPRTPTTNEPSDNIPNTPTNPGTVTNPDDTTSNGLKIPPGNNACRQAAYSTCMGQDGSTDYDSLQGKQKTTVDTCITDNANTNNCPASPLYLYGPKGTKVSITINTPIFNAAPSYAASYQTTLLTNGNFEIQGKMYDKISYDYLSAKRVSSPTKGVISTQGNLEQTVRSFAQKLGLNTKETTDLIDFANKNIISPFVFVSFYNEAISKQILPLSFSPQPDSYSNIVFYFKQLDQKPRQTPQLPTFKKIQRSGLTAVEISEIIDSD